MVTNGHVRIEFLIGLHEKGRDNGPDMVEARAADARTILADSYNSYTATRAVGTWDGGSEPTLLAFTIIPDHGPTTAEHAHNVARALADALGQECVALSMSPAFFTLAARTSALSETK